MIFYVIIFILGCCCGSFLNCVIYRLSTNQSFLRGRSFCPSCKHRLGFFDLIPILSFIILKGKCRYCGQRISIQYPLVEIATGLLFVLILNHELRIMNYGFNLGIILNSLFLILNSCFLIIIFVYDLKHYIIPAKVVYPAIFTALIFNFFTPLDMKLSNGARGDFYSFLLSALGASGFFFLIWLISRGKWVGFGDVKLVFLIGLFLGFPNVLVALFLSFFIGAIMGIGLIILGKKNLKSQVPFGPFLVMGTFIALFWGREIINWYFNLL